MNTVIGQRILHKKTTPSNPDTEGVFTKRAIALRLFVSIVLVWGLLPVIALPVYADNTAIETATSEEAVDGELLIVYEEESLALDEEVVTTEEVANAVEETTTIATDEIATQNEGEPTVTLEELGIIEQEEVAEPMGNQGTVTLVQLADGVSEEEAIEQLDATEGIAYVQPNYTYSLQTTTTDDPYAVDSTTSSSANQYYLYGSGVVEAWDDAKVEGSVTVATIDTGCNLQHPDLINNVDAEHAYDVTEDTLLSDAGVSNNGDAYGHGTLIAGVIAGEANNAIGMAGVSYNATVLPIKVFDTVTSKCSTSDVVKAYSYLDGLIDSGEVTNLKVINASLAYYASGNTETDEVLHSAIAAMVSEHDVLTVCAGGNGENGVAKTETCYPSDFDECLSVTALDTDGTVAAFSDYNEAKDISTYGVKVLTTNKSGSYSTSSGTSLASPQVAAAAALLWAADPDLTSSEVVSALQSTATEVSDMQETCGSAGAMDVEAAVTKVLENKNQKESSSDTEESGTDESTSLEGMDAVAATNKGTVVEGVYAIGLSASERQVADVSGGSSVNGANVQVYTTNATSAQRWYITEDSEGYLTIQNVGSGKVLDVSGGTAANGTNVQQYKANSTAAQKWVAVENADGTVTLHSALSKNLVLDISAGNTASGTNIQVYESNNTAAQKCYLYKDEDAVSSGQIIEDGTFVISLESGGVMDVTSGSVADGARLQSYSSNNTAAQSFSLEYDEATGFYLVRSVKSGKLLDADNGDCVPGGSVSQYGNSVSGYKQRLWAIEEFDGGYQFVNAANGLVLGISSGQAVTVEEGDSRAVTISLESSSYEWGAAIESGTYQVVSALSPTAALDVAGGSKADGANVQIYSVNGTDAQSWQISQDSDGYLILRNVGSNKVLDVSGGTAVSGINVQQYSSNNTNAQKWIPVMQPDGSYVFFSALGDGLVLDVFGGSTRNGSNVQLYDSNSTAAQCWVLI